MSEQLITKTTLSKVLSVAAHGIMASQNIMGSISDTELTEIQSSQVFYRLKDASMELKLDLSMEKSSDDFLIVNAAYLNADYCNEYGYNWQNASIIKANIEAIEPDAEMENKVIQIKEEEKEKVLEIIRKYKVGGEPPSIEDFKMVVGSNNIDDRNFEAYLTAVAATDYLGSISDLLELIKKVNIIEKIKKLKISELCRLQ